MERVKLIAAPGIQIVNSEISAYEISIETKKITTWEAYIPKVVITGV